MKYIQIIFSFLICILLSNCEKGKKVKTEIYNQKANEIIFRTIEENKCNCIVEIPKESMVEISNAENPSYDFRNELKKQLNVKSNSNLDSLISVSKKFKLDREKIIKKKIKVISKKDLMNFINGKSTEILKICPNGIMSIQKPIFDKNYKKAVFEYNFTFTCTRELPSPVYELENEKWNIINR